MAFGQSSGPPATGRQMRELQELLEVAGHSDFRDARGPMGFTQRQAGGKFTGPEVEEFIEQLQNEIYGDGPPAGSRAASPAEPQEKPAPRKAVGKRPAVVKKPTGALSNVSSEELAAELQSRGWIVAEP